MARSDSKRAQFNAVIAAMAPSVVDEDVLAELERRLSPVSRSYLRKLLKLSGCQQSPLVEGVAQSSMEDLERTLHALADEYESGNARAARACVIEAKDHLRWSLRRPALPPEQAAFKQEALLWMLTWLENPPLFRSWAALRKRASTGTRLSGPE